ncbi:hypothetical protein NDU88_004677 [Pleurodeles waltl]|uniref:Uncharacterized protein n=1 Tax=Pleurodeles waltl TaxID=8319 RepID=A0AAV7PER8_PLEWA|nr:hypothetical protein NDU88_004677 [Pleurodeles waltl]
MVGMSAMVPLSEDIAGPLAVLAAVSVVAVLAAVSVVAVLAVGSVVTVLAAGFVVAVLAAVSVVAVLAAGSVAAGLAAGMCQHLLREKHDVSCSLGRLPTGEEAEDCRSGCRRARGGAGGGAGGSAGGGAGGGVCHHTEPLVAGRYSFSLRDVGTFFTLAGGGMSLPSLRGTLAALMGGALDDPAVAGTTVPGDLVAQVMGWDLESLALGEGRRGVKGRGQGLPGKVF